MSDDNGGGKQYFDLDAQLSDKGRPRIKFKGKEYFVADLSARDILLFTRRVQTQQEMLAVREELFEQDLEEQIQSGDVDNVDMVKVEKTREGFADDLQDVFRETAIMMFHEILIDDMGDDQHDAQGKVKTKPMSKKVAENIKQREWLALQDTLQEINGVMGIQGEDPEGNVLAGNATP